MKKFTPYQEQWKRRDNSILLDVNAFDFKIRKRTRGRMRLFLGVFNDAGDFELTVPTILDLDEKVQDQIRKMVKFIILDIIKPQENGRKYSLPRKMHELL